MSRSLELTGRLSEHSDAPSRRAATLCKGPFADARGMLELERDTSVTAITTKSSQPTSYTISPNNTNKQHTATMVKLIAAALALAAAAMACDTACSAAQDRDGRCYYACTDNACHMSGTHHRDQFLNGLSTRGYDCKPEGATSLSCAKTADFGGCWSHKWTCGGQC
ncbi:aureobasidin resistance protein Aur1 [Purpureocillium lavendulum]|uniref:Aureobasidin resistance protein Aur1 n=1 Tax=Purpureocillium lavendulum TaxID=1247861 RepID=A0AB34FSC6_9HYPO|nr:aureobasidin resistance protein Aur1 [Purpureocillium lavendulum]